MPKHFNLNLRHGAFRTKWTPEKRQIGWDMRADGATFEEIGKVIGISHVACATELAKAPCPRNKNERRNPSNRTTESTRVPEQVLNERVRRIEAADRRGFAEILFGDPPRGYSALDQKRAGT